MPEISVIVPVYNEKAYLGECVKSILGQSFPDFELLLVDDGSTDGSLEAERQCKERDPRVHVTEKPHGGLGDTRNFGVKLAAGKYLVFVDSDDWIEPDMLRDLYSAAEAVQAQMVVFNFTRELPQGSRVCRLPFHYPEYGSEANAVLLSQLAGPDNAATPWNNAEMIGSAWRRMYLRSWFTENNITFGDERKTMLEDLPAAVAAHCACGKMLALGGAYYHYRYSPAALSIRYRPHKMEMLTACFMAVRRILMDRGLYDGYRERHLAWFLRSAAHSSLVNCFSPGNPSDFRGRWREVRGILRNPVLRRAVRSDYLKYASKADRSVLRILRTNLTPLVYLYYRHNTASLRKKEEWAARR